MTSKVQRNAEDESRLGCRTYMFFHFILDSLGNRNKLKSQAFLLICLLNIVCNPIAEIPPVSVGLDMVSSLDVIKYFFSSSL